MELAFDDVELPGIIESVLSTARGLVKDKPIKLITAIEDDLPIVTVDPTRIRQVLLNLISNASKFTDEGSITVTARKQTRKDGGREIYIAVTDTGAGIATEDQYKLFVPFSQVDGSPTRKVEGTGLGLSITRLLVDLHGGDIGVDSKLAQGSNFWFTLPLPNIKTEMEENNDLAIMAIDDDTQVISLYERYLDNAGFKVIPVTDPREALARARQIKPFAITLDIMMPDFDGWDLLETLKTDPFTRDIPIVVCSILAEYDKGIKLGAADYLTKPILEDDLVTALNKLRQYPGKLGSE
jgi:CheY-like chemotaxis protein